MSGKGNKASTGAGVKITESDIEKGRHMGEWRKVLDSLEASKAGKATTNMTSDLVFNFYCNEAKLEIWLEEHQPTEKFIHKARSGLIDIKKGLQQCLTTAGDNTGMKTDIRVQLAKINYSSGLYEEALEELGKSGFENTIDVQSIRNIQLMAEAHAIKAHCLEKLGRSWRGKQSLPEAERKKEILNCYHRSADMAIAFFQGQEKLLSTAYPLVGGSSPSPAQQWEKRRPSSLIEFAIRRGPALLIEDGQISDAIIRLQKLVRTSDTHFFSPIRLILFRRLAELILRDKWIPNTLVPAAIDTVVKLKYNVGTGLFTPHNVWEEIFLILFLSQSMVVKDGVLNQAPEFLKARKLANLNTTSVFDLLTLATSRWKQFSVLNECFEQALKYSFEEPYIWSQYGLTFLAAGVNSRKSYRTLIEASELTDRPTPLLLLAARQLLSQLQIEEAVKIIQKAKTQADPQKLTHRVYLYEGIALFLQSFEKHMNQQRLQDLNSAINSLQAAAEMDPLDYLSLHWLARVNAWAGNLNDAFSAAVKALRAFPFHLPTLQLIILLLSAQRNYTDALAVTEEALDEYPDHLGFLQMKAALDKKIFGPDMALMTLKQMLVIWKNLFDDGFGSIRSESPDFRGHTIGTLQLPSPIEKESSIASFRAASMAGSSTNTGTLTAGFKADAALSEIASSFSIHGSLNQAMAGELAWTAQISIWVMICDLYLTMGKPMQAASSIEEAAQISSTHPDVLFYRGRIEEHLENYKDARVWYESAVAVKPTHVKSLQSLALMQHYFGSHRLAEKTLQDSLKLDPYDHQTWYNLGKVLEALEECSEAGDCMATALEIEAVNPILPYSIIPVCFD